MSGKQEFICVSAIKILDELGTKGLYLVKLWSGMISYGAVMLGDETVSLTPGATRLMWHCRRGETDLLKL